MTRLSDELNELVQEEKKIRKDARDDYDYCVKIAGCYARLANIFENHGCTIRLRKSRSELEEAKKTRDNLLQDKRSVDRESSEYNGKFFSNARFGEEKQNLARREGRVEQQIVAHRDRIRETVDHVRDTFEIMSKFLLKIHTEGFIEGQEAIVSILEEMLRPVGIEFVAMQRIRNDNFGSGQVTPYENNSGQLAVQQQSGGLGSNGWRTLTSGASYSPIQTEVRTLPDGRTAYAGATTLRSSLGAEVNMLFGFAAPTNNP